MNKKLALLYTSIPLTGVISPLLVLPAITSSFGEAAWVSIAVGQSIGVAAATVVELGWSLTGPQRAARTKPNALHDLVLLSLFSRLLVILPISVIAVTFAFWVAPVSTINASLVAFVTVLNGLNFNWYFIGRQAPQFVLLFDSVPRIAALALTAFWTTQGASLMVYPLVGLGIPAVTATLGAILFLLMSTRNTPIRQKISVRRLVWVVRSQAKALAARVMSAFYTTLPVSLVSVVSPGSVAIFAAGERLMRIGLAGILTIPNAMQGWVGSARNYREKQSRVKKALILNHLLGWFAALVFGLLAPSASEAIFSGVATIPSDVAWSFSLVILIVCTSRATGSIGLVAANKVRTVAISATVGAVIGLPAVWFFASWWGTLGAVLGEVVAEAAVLAVQFAGLRQAAQTMRVQNQ